MKYTAIFFFIIMGICLFTAPASVKTAAAISLDDLDDLDRQDVEDYIQKARKAADRENFSEADDYLKKALKYGIEKSRIDKAKSYVSKKRQEQSDRLAAERKAEEERRAAAERESRQASESSSGSSSSSGGCSETASLVFESTGGTFTGTCAGSRNIQITSLPQGIYIQTNKDNFVFVYDFNRRCIQGNYSFTYTAKAGMACDKSAGYSGSFYLDGNYRNYTINLSGNSISVIGY